MITEPSHSAPAAPAQNPRYAQMFPVLNAAEIDRLRRFGRCITFADGEWLFRAGEPMLGMFILLSGQVTVTTRDGLGHVRPVVEQGPGQFLGETGQLSQRSALVDGRAEGPVEALLIAPERLRALIVAEAELGERIMRALILRTVGLLQNGATGPALIGPAEGRAMNGLREFLRRNAIPHHVIEPADVPEAAELVSRHAQSPADLPLVVCPDGSILRNPTEQALARSLGMGVRRQAGRIYDVAIVGAGPAGLATAVYSGSEGLSVAVLDARSYGGQAGASARIENYFGFPTGISGLALAGRAFVQAQKFGVEMLIPSKVAHLDCNRDDGLLALEIENDAPVLARSVVVASGARYRRPAIAELSRFEGCGVWYWASASEIRLCAGEEVIVVGGGNSAGQAAVHLSGHVRRVRMMVRGPGLAQSMSRYLIDRIEATGNVEVMTGTEIVALEGAEALSKVRWSCDGTAAEGAVRHLFIFAGADPATDWLATCGVGLDAAGFVVTGATCGTGTEPLQTAVPGVFAVGDARSGSVKRVGAAIGEGAQVSAMLHRYLSGSLPWIGAGSTSLTAILGATG
ncbi:MAG: FAD-dependent oxidoreductase [Cypionkella sp.]